MDPIGYRQRAIATTCVLGLAGGGCGDDDEPSPDPPSKQVRAAELGEAVQLRSDTGRKLRVAVTQVQDPVRRHRFKDTQLSGRFVGIELRITNEGDLRVRESPWSGARLSTSKGAERPTQMLQQGSCLRARRRVIAPGVTHRVCLPFRVNEGATPLKFRYSPGGGFTPIAGVWDLQR